MDVPPRAMPPPPAPRLRESWPPCRVARRSSAVALRFPRAPQVVLLAELVWPASFGPTHAGDANSEGKHFYYFQHFGSNAEGAEASEGFSSSARLLDVSAAGGEDRASGSEGVGLDLMHVGAAAGEQVRVRSGTISGPDEGSFVSGGTTRHASMSRMGSCSNMLRSSPSCVSHSSSSNSVLPFQGGAPGSCRDVE